MELELDRETHAPAFESAVEPPPFVEAPALTNGPMRWPYFVLALAALAAALWPQFVSTHDGATALSWPLLELPGVKSTLASLPDSASPLAGFMLLVVSGLAAAGLLALTAGLAQGLVRPVLMHAYAVLAWVGLYAFEGLGAQVFDGPSWLHGENPLLPVAGTLGLVAAALVYAGAVARVRMPASRVAGAAGVLGLLWFGVALLYPFSPPDIGFMQPVKLMFTEQGVWAHQVIGFFRLAAMVALAAAGVELGRQARCPGPRKTGPHGLVGPCNAAHRRPAYVARVPARARTGALGAVHHRRGEPWPARPYHIHPRLPHLHRRRRPGP